MMPKKLTPVLILLCLAGIILALFSMGPSSIHPDQLIRAIVQPDYSYPNKILELNDSTASAALIHYHLLVLDFYYPGCRPCKAMNITNSELSDKLKGQVVFGKIAFKKNSSIIKRFNVSSYPSTLVFKDGKLVARLTGYRSALDLAVEIKKWEPGLDTSNIKPANYQPVVGENSPTLPMLVTDSEMNFVLGKYSFVVLEGFTNWCSFCKNMNVTLSELSSELKGQVAFGLINAEKNNLTRKKYNITSYPMLLIFKDGKLISIQKGNRPKSNIVSLLKGLKPDLNTSLVKLSDVKSSTISRAAPASVKAPVLLNEIPLAKLGQDKPELPVLVTDSTLNFALSKYPFFVLVGFANWCSFCRNMNVTLSELSGELKGQVTFGLIDAEKNSQTSRKYNITSYPTLMIFKNGILIDTQEGYRPKSDLVGMLKKMEPALDTRLVEPSKTQMTSNIPSKNTVPAKPKKTCKDITKQDKPLMQVFVVSYCPFGLQMQRILSEIVSKFPAISQYIKVRYIGNISAGKIVSMHGMKEADENLRQICIREEQGERYWKYISSFIKSGISDSSLKDAGIDISKVNSCIADQNRGLKYANVDFSMARQFKASGSPTLILNGESASETDFGGRTDEAVKTLLCCSFKSMPIYCNEKLNTSKVATGFLNRLG